MQLVEGEELTQSKENKKTKKKACLAYKPPSMAERMEEKTAAMLHPPKHGILHTHTHTSRKE